MFTKAATKLTALLVNNQIISEEDFEVYCFGFKAGFVILLNVLVTISIGFILWMPLESLLILLVFIPLRSCAGGIHTSNNIKCFFASTFFVFLVLIAARAVYGLFDMPVSILTGFICSIIIFALAPVQDANKPLNNEDKRKLKRHTLRVLCILFGLLLVLFFLRFVIAVNVFVFTLFLVCLSVCTGALKNYIKHPRV